MSWPPRSAASASSRRSARPHGCSTHILSLFDSGEVAGFTYYVMPYVDGESLRQRLDRERQLPIDDATRIARAVASALAYAHRQAIIHRDIKPENILLHDGEPMVADFGIALAIRAAGGERLTGTGLSLGTPQYMSPEQATADRDLTARSDIYSLACVLYEMLAGSPPHNAASAQAVVVQILTDETRPVSELRRAVPPHISDALARALEKLPADRFESAAAFESALSNPSFRYHRGMVVASPAAPLTPDMVVPRRSGRPWLLDPRSVVVLALLCAATAWVLLPRSADLPPVPAVTAGLALLAAAFLYELLKRRQWFVKIAGVVVALLLIGYVNYRYGVHAEQQRSLDLRRRVNVTSLMLSDSIASFRICNLNRVPLSGYAFEPLGYQSNRSTPASIVAPHGNDPLNKRWLSGDIIIQPFDCEVIGWPGDYSSADSVHSLVWAARLVGVRGAGFVNAIDAENAQKAVKQ